MTVRSAVASDAEAIFSLGQSVSEFSVNKETVSFWPESLLENAISSKDTFIIVAEESEKLVGFVIAIYNDGFRKATIENIYISQSLRNQGIGKLLLEELLEQLSERKCEYIATLVPLDADSATKLYESEGFLRGEQFLWLDKSLGSNFKRVST